MTKYSKILKCGYITKYVKSTFNCTLFKIWYVHERITDVKYVEKAVVIRHIYFHYLRYYFMCHIFKGNDHRIFIT